jgi:uncharacterized membrane protein YfcA
MDRADELHFANSPRGHLTMWEYYRKTFARMQMFILLISGALYYALGHRVVMVATFFAMMQVGAVVGAWWGARLRRRMGPQI